MSRKITEAEDFATKAHAGQFRKDGRTPYITHPLAVSSLVVKYGGSEEQAIAALLHDVIEDCSVTAEEIEKRFGTHVALMVVECSDSTGSEDKGPWLARKEKYIAHLGQAHPDSLLVSAADKLHNTSMSVHDLTNIGPSVWKQFSTSRELVIWYYTSLLKAFQARQAGSGYSNLLIQLEIQVQKLCAL